MAMARHAHKFTNNVLLSQQSHSDFVRKRQTRISWDPVMGAILQQMLCPNL